MRAHSPDASACADAAGHGGRRRSQRHRRRGALHCLHDRPGRADAAESDLGADYPLAAGRSRAHDIHIVIHIQLILIRRLARNHKPHCPAHPLRPPYAANHQHRAPLHPVPVRAAARLQCPRPGGRLQRHEPLHVQHRALCRGRGAREPAGCELHVHCQHDGRERAGPVQWCARGSGSERGSNGYGNGGSNGHGGRPGCVYGCRGQGAGSGCAACGRGGCGRIGGCVVGVSEDRLSLRKLKC